jgi:quercetin 2,3-dioxygenase
MAKSRQVAEVHHSRPTIEGAGVHLKRAFGFGEVGQFDPFLLLDDFHASDPAKYLKGFPWHPHRGIETITYMLEGRVEHGDSMGNRGVIVPGEIQWMTAGSGIIHQEMPKGEAEGRMWGFQLWANLPASHKMMDPRYREVKAAQIPEVALEGGAQAKVVAGTVHGVQGPVRDIVSDPTYLDITLPPGAKLSHAVPRGHTALAYTVAGTASFGPARDRLDGVESLIRFGDGDHLEVAAGEETARFLLFTGQPLGEPIAWYGPIVMNTQEELRLAFEEYERGTFVKHG